MKITKTITTTPVVLSYDNGNIMITVDAPSVVSETLLTDTTITSLIRLVEKTGVLIIDNTRLSAWETAGVLVGLKMMRRDNHWCYLCDTNRNGLYHYQDWNVMIHSRRLPRK